MSKLGLPSAILYQWSEWWVHYSTVCFSFAVRVMVAL